METYNYLAQQDKWLQERIGKFTSCEIFKLLTKGRGKDQYFGQAAQTYIAQKAAELMTDLSVSPFLDNLKSVEWGTTNEPVAVAEYELRFNCKVEYFGKANPLFFEYSRYTGGSPDAMLDAKTGMEIKCPFNSGEHVQHLLLETAADLLDYEPKYYWQCIANMLFTNAEAWKFVSFDPRFPEEYQLHVIDIAFNEAHVNELKERISRAEDELEKMVVKLIKKQEKVLA